MMRNLSPSERGFTLIEMLVALAVFSIAALALMRLDSYALAVTGDLGERRMAALVVANEAALAATDPVLTIGNTSNAVSNGGRRFLVTRRVTSTADARLVRVDIVAAPDGGRGRAALTIVKRVS